MTRPTLSGSSPIVDWNTLPKKKVWVPKQFWMDGRRPSLPLMHLSPRDDRSEVAYWNRLREVLQDNIEVIEYEQLEDAGPVIVIPHYLEEYAFSGTLAPVLAHKRAAVQSGRKVIHVVQAWDYLPIQGETTLTPSMYQRKQDAVCMPAWLYDFHSHTRPITWAENPQIGFVGHATYHSPFDKFIGWIPGRMPNRIRTWYASTPSLRWTKKAHGLMHKFRLYAGRWVRQDMLAQMKQASGLTFDFVERKGDFFHLPDEVKARYKQEYIDNLIANQYRLVARGDCNFAYSFYETLSTGRIPVLIDTEWVLPDISPLRWDEVAVIVPYNKIHELEKRVLDFHNNLGPDGLAEASRKARLAYEYLHPENFVGRVIWPMLAPAEHLEK